MKLLTDVWGFLLKLLTAVPGAPKPSRPETLPQEVPFLAEPKWLQLARQDLGVKEVPGPTANPQIMSAWRYVDCEPPNDDSTAWCSAKMCEWVERSGLPSTRAPNARSWLKWGAELKKPKPGCLAVLWRNSPTSWEGHICIYLGPGSSPGTIRALGGNQGKEGTVSIQNFSEARVLSYRWPTTGGNSRTLKAQTAGLVLGDGMTGLAVTGAAMDSQGIIGSLPDALAVGTALQSLAAYWPWFMVIGVTVSILARLVTIFARLSDWQTKGV